jgi:iron(III) transport system substrate-binding protein
MNTAKLIFSCGRATVLLCGATLLLYRSLPAAERLQVWEETVAAAKKEGQVTIYGYGSPALLPVDAGVFQKKFPEIKVVTVSGDPVPRILSERRAGKYLADVAIGGITTPWQLYLAKALDPIRDALILSEVLDESKWWGGKHRYTDPERRYAFVFIGSPQTGGIYYNAKLVNPKEFQFYRDFLNPKWKGKIQVRDIRSPGPGGDSIKLFYYIPELGPDFIKRLIRDMDVTLYRDRRQAVDWLATGKFAICFFCPNSDIRAAERQGLPVAAFGSMKEGVGLGSSVGNMGLLNNAPHPNAAKVFINWLLSREGQFTLQTARSRAGIDTSNSLRIDIPKDMIPPEERLQDNVNYIDVQTPERMAENLALKVFEEALAEASAKGSRQ